MEYKNKNWAKKMAECKNFFTPKSSCVRKLHYTLLLPINISLKLKYRTQENTLYIIAKRKCSGKMSNFCQIKMKL